MSVQLTGPPILAAPVSGRQRGGPSFRACVRWSWRLLRRGAMLLWLAVATYLTVEILAFRSAYPDATSRQKLVQLSSSSAVRMLQGVPGSIDRAAGYAVWDGGWMLMLIVASWVVLAVTRLTRGEEDAGRAELLLSRPATAGRLLAADLAGLAIALVGLAVAAALPFAVLGEPVAGGILWGAGLAAFGAVCTGLAALSAQLLAPRRRAVSLAMAVAAAAFLLRVVANSSDRRAWLLAVTPFGWLDRLHAFAGDRWRWLLAPVLTAALLGLFAIRLAGRRDSGAAVLRPPEHPRSRYRLLGGPAGFGWRLTSGALTAWAVGLAVTSLVFGLMVGAVVDFINQDETYRRLLETMGMDMSVPVVGFLSYITLFLALPLAAFAGWRLGAARQEEADGRLDNLLVRGVVRWRWLAATAALAVLAALGLALAGGAGLWIGARSVDAEVTVRQVTEPMAGTLPLIVLFTGIATLTFGALPRLTVAVPVLLAVLGYLLDTFGAMLHWPAVLIGLSPFHHLARLPGAPMSLTSVLVMSGLGLLAAVAGVLAFARRDLHGG